MKARRNSARARFRFSCRIKAGLPIGRRSDADCSKRRFLLLNERTALQRVLTQRTFWPESGRRRLHRETRAVRNRDRRRQGEIGAKKSNSGRFLNEALVPLRFSDSCEGRAFRRGGCVGTHAGEGNSVPPSSPLHRIFLCRAGRKDAIFKNEMCELQERRLHPA